MRGNKFEKLHIHILEPETLSREFRVTESRQEIVVKPLIIASYRPIFTICQHFYTLCGKERRRERMMSPKPANLWLYYEIIR